MYCMDGHILSLSKVSIAIITTPSTKRQFQTSLTQFNLHVHKTLNRFRKQI